MFVYFSKCTSITLQNLLETLYLATIYNFFTSLKTQLQFYG